MAVVLQELVDADCAGVLFTRNPLDGADELVVEAAWGLGERVVAGLVTPDRFRVARDGTVLERVAGEKDLAVSLRPRRHARGRDLQANAFERSASTTAGSRRSLTSRSVAGACSRALATSSRHSRARRSTLLQCRRVTSAASLTR